MKSFFRKTIVFIIITVSMVLLNSGITFASDTYNFGDQKVVVHNYSKDGEFIVPENWVIKEVSVDDIELIFITAGKEDYDINYTLMYVGGAQIGAIISVRQCSPIPNGWIISGRLNTGVWNWYKIKYTGE